ncbi:hypothetical protein HanRHA438_Chr13g0629821 [Helianthus annuus]|nr:hypothetical protein HanRHA438_Chr13g0629821 [Helianthus annuus]
MKQQASLTPCSIYLIPLNLTNKDLNILTASKPTNLIIIIIKCKQLTGILGSLPSLKLLIVPNSPSYQIGNASFRTFVLFRSSKCACDTSIFANIASLSSCQPQTTNRL